jgi:hypothetical protein
MYSLNKKKRNGQYKKVCRIKRVQESQCTLCAKLEYLNYLVPHVKSDIKKEENKNNTL